MLIYFYQEFERLITYCFGSQVSLIDASSFERRLQEEVYEKWAENTEIIQLTRIPKSDIPGFVNQMAATVQGNLFLSISKFQR